jgi:hypothetical protein
MAIEQLDKIAFTRLLQQKKKLSEEIAKDVDEFYKAKGEAVPLGDIMLATNFIFLTRFNYSDAKMPFELIKFIESKMAERSVSLELNPTTALQDKMWACFSLLQRSISAMLAIVEIDDEKKAGETNV